MLPVSPGPACARSLLACGVPCQYGATARSGPTGSGIRCRIQPQSTHRPRGSSVAGWPRSRLSAGPVAPPSAGSCPLHGRSSPDLRSRLPDRVGTRSGSCRRRATALRRSTDNSFLCPAAPAHWHGGPAGARRNRREPTQSGRGAIRCPGSQVGSSMKQNRLPGDWQGLYPDFRRVGVYNRKRHSEIDDTPLARFLAGPAVTRLCPDAAALRLAFTRTERRTLRKSDVTTVIEGRRFEVPSRYRHLALLEVRFAAWDLTQVHLVDPHTGTVLCRLFPQDKAANASGLRRGVQPITAEPVTPPPRRGIGPLLERMIDRQIATGLPPAYLPKDEGDDA